MNSETKICQNCKKDFAVESEDFRFYEKISVPPPTFCPECRMRRRFAWRNERNLYKRKDDKTGEEIFSGFSPGAPVKVYEKEYWISDAWDPLRYGREYDFTRPFFEQFKEFAYAVPWPSRSITRLVNSDYCDQAGDLKNCYLCFNCDHVEDSAYVVRSVDTKNCFDMTQSRGNELCYEGVSLGKCYRSFFSRDCDNCLEVWFSQNCIGCTSCFGCANLRNKSHCFLNVQLSKEEYEKKLKELKLDSWSGIAAAAKTAAAHAMTFPVKYFHGIRAVDSTGEYLKNTKNVKQSWFVEDGQDMRYCQDAYLTIKDSYDYSVWGNGVALAYECLTCGENVSGLKFCFDCWPSCRDIEYCIACRSSSNLFACVGLKKKQYCIFNKQYTKEEFRALREKIIEHMRAMPYTSAKGIAYSYGEFFPEEFSPFGYNETMLGDTYPVAKEEALRQGYRWYEQEVKKYEITARADELPDSITGVSDSVLKETIACSSCGRAYRVIQSELSFLKQTGLPLPRFCVACRLARRFAFVNKPTYHRRKCQCAGAQPENGAYRNTDEHFHGQQHCPNEFETSYAPERPEIVYCEQCYQAEAA